MLSSVLRGAGPRVPAPGPGVHSSARHPLQGTGRWGGGVSRASAPGPLPGTLGCTALWSAWKDKGLFVVTAGLLVCLTWLVWEPSPKQTVAQARPRWGPAGVLLSPNSAGAAGSGQTPGVSAKSPCFRRPAVAASATGRRDHSCCVCWGRARHPRICLWGLGSLPAQPRLTAVWPAQTGDARDPVTRLWDPPAGAAVPGTHRWAPGPGAPATVSADRTPLCSWICVFDGYKNINGRRPRFPHPATQPARGLQPQTGQVRSGVPETTPWDHRSSRRSSVEHSCGRTQVRVSRGTGPSRRDQAPASSRPPRGVLWTVSNSAGSHV